MYLDDCKMTKIYEVEGHCVCGQTDIERKVILINKNLRKYPDLRKFILRHEKQHLKDNSYWKAFLLDMKDYPVLYSNLEFWKFHYKYVQESGHHKFFGAWYKVAISMTAPFIGSYYLLKHIIKLLRKR